MRILGLLAATVVVACGRVVAGAALAPRPPAPAPAAPAPGRPAAGPAGECRGGRDGPDGCRTR